MKIGLKAGERLFLNGAVIRVERKTQLELMNDAVFLLEGHILQQDEATTPLRQIYFILQSMVMDPTSAPMMRDLFEMVLLSVRRGFSDEDVLDGLDEVAALAGDGRWFDAMKLVRNLYPIEDDLMSPTHNRKVAARILAAV
ncbi:flagellar biosynthesis repressor FlbT [Roseibium polysiphoniae]|uniref:Flagellar biosynthesis repressor FlbT n=1 Tax=Roseibium polysiphoniae TaxID=2571221 RepID=A0A944CEK4_9HYPH|nr:flagellar biosynthesis repressor FlbT [Roseibium polysiphoniae]MBS8260791.1 flagellar biosynthesis repressor FlbT [Roseibium polysiphoniae]